MSGLWGLVPMEAEPEPAGGAEGETFEAPGVSSFDLPPIFPGVPWFDKYMLQAIVAVILVLIFWLVMASKNKMVPSKGQFIGETAYFFVRNSIARDTLGHDFKRFLPFLIALFSFILVNNLWGIFPFTLLPTASHAGWAYGLAAMVWVLYNGVGIAKHGFFGYLKNTTLPSGRAGVHVALDHSAGVLLQHHRPARSRWPCDSSPTCSPATCWCCVRARRRVLAASTAESIVNKTAGVVAWIFSMAIFALEIFVQSLQAFIFTVLTAVYLSSALAEEH